MATTRHNAPGSDASLHTPPVSPAMGVTQSNADSAAGRSPSVPGQKRVEQSGRDVDRERDADRETVPDTIGSSIRGEDKPMEREHPRAPGALVLFSYPLALVAVLLIAAVILILIF